MGLRLPKIGGSLGQLQKDVNLKNLLNNMPGGGMDTSGRGQVVPRTNEFGDPWDFGEGAPEGQRTPEQAAKDRAAEDLGKRDETRDQQTLQIGRLRAAAAGEGPSAAQDQLQLGTDNNMRQALAMAASGRGNPALAGQHAGRQRAMAGQQMAAQSGALRAQEMNAAQAQLGGALQAQRGQDLSDQQRELGYAQLESQSANAEAQRASDRGIARRQASSSDMSGLLSAGATGLAAYAAFASDERVKKDKSNVPDAEVDEFYKALEAKNFKYKDPHAAGSSGGEKVGLMAQDVENTKLGDKLFSDGPGGVKSYDPQVLDGILLAGMKKLMKDQKYGDA